MKKKILYNLPLSPLGMGCYGIGGAYGIKDEYLMREILQLAYQLGVRYFDTADQYGNAEEILGQAVQPFRQKITIASKVGLGKNNQPDLSREHIISSCENSLMRLKTDYLDLYQVHYDDPDTPISETIATLELLKKEGKIRYYGIGHLPREVSKGYLAKGNISTIMAEMNAATTQRYRELHPLQSEYNFGIIPFSITGRGLLTGKIDQNTQFDAQDIRRHDPFFNRAKLQSGLRIVDKLKELGQECGKSPVQMAIGWVLAQEGVLTALTGPTKKDHLRENLKIMNWKMEESLITELNLFLEVEEKRLASRVNEEINTILSSKLDPNLEQAVADLIYVMENLAERGKLDSKEIISYYQKVMKIYKSNDVKTQHLVEVQQALQSQSF